MDQRATHNHQSSSLARGVGVGVPIDTKSFGLLVDTRALRQSLRLGCSSVAEYWPSMQKASGSIPSAVRKNVFKTSKQTKQ